MEGPMKDHRGDRGRRVNWRRLAGALCAAGGILALGSTVAAEANANHAVARGCQSKPGAVVRTLQLNKGDHIHTVRAHVGDTIEVIAYTEGYHRVQPPEPFDHKHAVCQISVHRKPGSEVIAKFRTLRVRRKRITFGSSGVSSAKGCPPDSHGCPHPVLWIGYVKIKGRGSAGARPNCAERGPFLVHHNEWSKAQMEMAPRGALRIQLCRYTGIDTHPRFELVGSDLIVSRGLKRQIISRLDALKPYTGPPPHCPAESGKAVGITLFYREHRVRIAVNTDGCAAARNGDISRPAFNTRAGRLLVKQLIALTPREQG